MIMNEQLKETISGIDFSRYQDKLGRVAKTAPSSIKTLKKIQDFAQVHGWDTYDYSSFKYLGARIKSTIICPIHGKFEQTPGDHTKGQGCPSCRNTLGDTNILYMLRSASTGTYKIGIINNLSRRITSIGDTLTLICEVTLPNPREHEKILHKRYQKVRRFNANANNGGTEFFQLSSEQVEEVKCYFNSVQQEEI